MEPNRLSVATRAACLALRFAARAIPVLLLGHALCASGLAQGLPTRLREILAKHLEVSDRQMKTVERGGLVAFSAKTRSSEDIMLVGIARIWATPEAYVRGYRDICTFESSPGVTACGKFSLPPVESDFAGLKLTQKNVDELSACQPGDCAFKIGDAGLNFLGATVNWGATDSVEQANRAVRLLWLQNLFRYQDLGSAGLAVYHDKPEYFSVEDGLRDILRQAADLQAYAPHLIEYLRNYPASKNEAAEEFFYWQEGAFGLKPVHRVSQVVIEKIPATYGDGYVIASEMLFASHYFRSALEIGYLIPGQDQRQGAMHYLVSVQRSRVDGMTGLRGHFLRAIVTRRARQAMEWHIANVKQRVELEFNGPR